MILFQAGLGYVEVFLNRKINFLSKHHYAGIFEKLHISGSTKMNSLSNKKLEFDIMIHRTPYLYNIMVIYIRILERLK